MKSIKHWSVFLMLLIFMTVLAACGGNNEADQDNPDKDDATTDQGDDQDTIQVDLENSDEESVGTATLEEKSKGVNVTFEGKNLPKGIHAFHIHEKSACEAPDFESAEGHYNPEDTDHGFDTEDGPHAGDMPNIAVDDDGEVTQSFLVKDVTLDENGDHSLVAGDGTSLIIHEGADDDESQPSGDAGDRLACGTISD